MIFYCCFQHKNLSDPYPNNNKKNDDSRAILRSPIEVCKRNVPTMSIRIHNSVKKHGKQFINLPAYVIVENFVICYKMNLKIKSILINVYGVKKNPSFQVLLTICTGFEQLTGGQKLDQTIDKCDQFTVAEPKFNDKCCHNFYLQTTGKIINLKSLDYRRALIG